MNASCLVCAMVLSAAGDTPAPAPAVQLRNDNLELSINLAMKDGHCRLTDRKTGLVYAARDLGVIRAWDNTEDRMRTLLITPEAPNAACNVTIERKNDQRAVVHVDTGAGSASAMGRMSFGIAFDIELTLDGNRFEYAIPIASLQERLPIRWRLMNIELFPLLGATPAGSPGYLVIPTWSGGVYYFDRQNPRANRQFQEPGYGDLGTESGLDVRWNFRPDAPAEYGSMMYGIQAAWEDQLQQPIYATMREGGGLAGILLGGEYDTELRARRDQGPDRTASVNPIWHYRSHWHSKLDRVDRRVRLVALGPEQATYAGLGNLFREFLIRERGVKTLRERAATNEYVKYFVDGIYIRVMMGMKHSGVMKSYESWDDFAATVPMFKEAGFDRIQFVFVGANFGGHDGAHPTVFPLETAHGGEEGFRRAIAALDKAGYHATFHLNYKDVYQCSPDWNEDAIQINECGELRLHGAWIGGFSYQGIPQEMLERFGRRDLPKLRKLGLSGMHYWDACLSVMEETYPPHRVITRREYGEGAMAYFRYAANLFGTVGCETSIAPLLGLIVNAGNTNYPNGGASRIYPANGYCEAALLDHWVPLQHVIYHGLCCYGGDAETGGRTGTEFNAAPTKDEIEQLHDRYVRYQEWGGDLQYEFITDHVMVAPMVFRTTFSDGTRTWVNRTREDWTGDGVTVTAKGYVVRRPD